MCMFISIINLYLCIRLPLLCFHVVRDLAQDCYVSSALLLYSVLKGKVGVVLWLPQPAPRVCQMCFCLARIWGLACCVPALFAMCRLWTQQDAKGHRGKIPTPPSRWQQVSCIEGWRAAVRSYRVWQQGSSSSARSPFQKDALETVKRAHIGHVDLSDICLLS